MNQFQRNRATAGFNRAQVFQLGWVYELPFGKGKAYLNSGGLVSKVIGGWQFSGIESCYTGTPLTVTANGTSLNAPDEDADRQSIAGQRPRAWSASARVRTTTTQPPLPR